MVFRDRTDKMCDLLAHLTNLKRLVWGNLSSLIEFF